MCTMLNLRGILGREGLQVCAVSTIDQGTTIGGIVVVCCHGINVVAVAMVSATVRAMTI